MLKLKNMDIEDGKRFDESEWVGFVKSTLEDKARPEEYDDGLIHTVPKPLLTESSMIFYLPRVISFGPYHFQRLNAERGMELLKSQVAREFHDKIIQDGRQEGLNFVVEKFIKREFQEKLKKGYCLEAIIELSSEAFAWMIVRDACFSLEVLDIVAGESVSLSCDSVPSKKRHYPMLTEIVKDMLKMENQLPLWAVEEIMLDLKVPQGRFVLAVQNLSPIKGRISDWEQPKKFHVLHLLYEYAVDRGLREPHGSAGFPSIFVGLCRAFVGLCRALVYPISLLLLSPFFVIWFIIFVIWYDIRNHIDPQDEIRTVEKLKRAGLKFEILNRGISRIKLDQSTLSLPELDLDYRSEVIIRNLIALEMCFGEEQKPFLRYAFLMKDLIKNKKDVAVLRREGVITGKLKDDEIAQLWNSLELPIEMPRYVRIDEVAASLESYNLRNLKFLWAEFVGLLIEFCNIHCSRPWLLLSLWAGVVLLVLTLVQVICLFEPCQRN